MTVLSEVAASPVELDRLGSPDPQPDASVTSTIADPRVGRCQGRFRPAIDLFRIWGGSCISLWRRLPTSVKRIETEYLDAPQFA